MKKMEISVAGILLSPDRNQVLLIQRRDVPVWVLPGGGLEMNETPEEAVLREMKEETGLECSIDRLVGKYEPVNRLTRLTYLFALSSKRGTPSTGTETKAIAFFPINHLPKLLPPPYENWIRETLKNSSYTIHRKLKEITYFKLLVATFSHPLLVFRFLLARFSLPINDKK